MTPRLPTMGCRRGELLLCTAAAALLGAVTPHSALAQTYIPGDLVFSSSTFQPNTGEAANLTPGSQIVVDGTGLTSGGAPVLAIANDSNLGVFTNSAVDGNFGLTSALSISSAIR